MRASRGHSERYQSFARVPCDVDEQLMGLRSSQLREGRIGRVSGPKAAQSANVYRHTLLQQDVIDWIHGCRLVTRQMCLCAHGALSNAPQVCPLSMSPSLSLATGAVERLCGGG